MMFFRFTAMNLFVVLALVSFSGCQANVLRSDEPKQHLELVKDAFWGYFVEALQTAIGGLKTIEESKLAQQVNDKIREGVEVARHYRDIVEEQVIIISDELHKKISEHVEQLSESLKPDVNELRAQLEPLTEKLRANIQQHLQEVRQVLDPYTESLEIESLRNTLRELSNTADSNMSELRNRLAPSTEELAEKVYEGLSEIDRRFRPLIEHSISEVMGDDRLLAKTLGPYIEDLRVGREFLTQALKSQFTALWESSAQIA